MRLYILRKDGLLRREGNIDPAASLVLVQAAARSTEHIVWTLRHTGSRQVVLEQISRDLVDAVGRNYVSSKRLTPCCRRERVRIKDRISEFPKVSAEHGNCWSKSCSSRSYHLAQSLIVGEEPGAIAADWSADGSAELIPFEIFRCSRKKVSCIKNLITKIVEDFAVKPVGSTLCHDIDQPGI